MSIALLSPNASERWLSGVSRIGRFSTTTCLFVLASLFVHLLLVGTAVVTGGPPSIASRQEIAVEVVHEIPQSAPETPKVAKTEPPKPAPARTVQAKQTAGRQTPPPPVAKDDDQAKKLEALESELQALKAEHAAMAAARTAPALTPQNTGLGPLPDSFQAVAMPNTADGTGEAVGYQEVVFSALAKAKGIGRTQGLPGSTGVHFEIDAAGRLVSVEIVHRSGVPSLDEEALAIVRKAAPFPPPPQGAQQSFDANVSFAAESER